MQVNSLVLRGTDIELLVQKSQTVLSKLFASFRVHSILFVLVVLYITGTNYVQQQVGAPVELSLLSVLRGQVATVIVPLMLLGVVLMRFYHVVVHARPEHPLPYLIMDVGKYLSKPTRFLNAIPTVIAVIYFIECFSMVKDSIPLMNSFSWDVAFMELDRSLHFGVDPWRLLQPVLGQWWITLLINFFYNIWFFVIWFVIVGLAFAEKQSQLRLQYFVSFFLTWSIGGSLLAIVFSSAGPAFYGKLGLGPDPYAPLMAYLNQSSEIVNLWALNTQGMLWEAYMNNNVGLVSGISAMPSMHNATAALLAFLGWRVSRLAGIAGTVFAVMILIGSVHLGWHYAIDGYAAIVLAGFFWWLSGHLVRWYMALPFIQRDIDTLQEKL